MSAVETIKAAYAAFGRYDPSVLFAAMDSAIEWNEAEGIWDVHGYFRPGDGCDWVPTHHPLQFDDFTVGLFEKKYASADAA